MTEKEKQLQRRKAEDAVFNRMLLFLLAAVIAEVVILLVKHLYMNIPSVVVANALYYLFGVLQFAGIVLAVVCAVRYGICRGKEKKSTLPGVLAGVFFALWLIALLTYQLNEFGLKILMALPAVYAVLVLIWFLYQRAFFVGAILTGGGMAAMLVLRRYWANHPTAVTLAFVAGFVVLVVVALLLLKLSKSNGKLGKLRLMPEGSSYGICWATCVVVAVALVLALLLGAAVAYYLLFALVAWLFCQAVFFTVKLM